MTGERRRIPSAIAMYLSPLAYAGNRLPRKCLVPEKKMEVEDTIIWPPTHFARCLELREQASKAQAGRPGAFAFCKHPWKNKNTVEYCSYLKGVDLEENVSLTGLTMH